MAMTKIQTAAPRRSPASAALALTTALAATFVAVPAAARPMTQTDLTTLKRIAAPTVSPDGTMAAYQLRETDLEANKGRTDIYVLKLGGTSALPSKIASKPEYNEHDPAFSTDSKSVYYISDESGSDQIWRYDFGNQTARQLSKFKTDVGGFKLSPNGKSLVIWGDVARQCTSLDCDSDAEINALGKTAPSGDTSKPGPGTGREYNQLFVRHWDAWETPGNYSRPFTYALDAQGTLSGGKPMDGDLIGDAPSKPFGGGEEIAWAADSKSVFFTLRKADKDEANSTNLDIYHADAATGKVHNATPNNAATDTMPVPSPDGKWLAYAAMARPTYESDRQVLMLRDLKTGKVHALSEKWDRSVASIAWATDSKSLYVTANEILDNPVFQLDMSGKVTRLTTDGHVTDVMPLAGGALIYGVDSIHAPTELYRRDAKGNVTQLTDVNGAALAQIDKVALQRFDFKGANGDQVWGQIIKPADGTGKLPIAFIVHGGPQGSFGNSWSYRWNPKVIASQGYAAVSIDFHGSTGYGQAFTDSINKDWGGKPLEDLKLGLAAAGKIDTQTDITNACALGASYGGYMMNWIAGQWADGFKCLVQHDGVFDARAMAYETEELWFDEWEHGGPYYAVPQEYEKWNPVNHVANWKTPMLVITGEKDFRIPYTQGLAAFTALQRLGVPSKLLVFPDENHWVLKPKNSIQWHNNVFGWLNTYLKGDAAD